MLVVVWDFFCCLVLGLRRIIIPINKMISIHRWNQKYSLLIVSFSPAMMLGFTPALVALNPNFGACFTTIPMEYNPL